MGREEVRIRPGARSLSVSRINYVLLTCLNYGSEGDAYLECPKLWVQVASKYPVAEPFGGAGQSGPRLDLLRTRDGQVSTRPKGASYHPRAMCEPLLIWVNETSVQARPGTRGTGEFNHLVKN